jgi:hypothetical protein
MSGSEGVLAAVDAHQDFISRETLARRLAVGSDLKSPDVSEMVDINGRQVRVSLKRHDGR